MRIKSFAKVNLGIEILRKRSDGYHEIRTLFQTIDFYDEINFRKVPSKKLSLFGDDDSVPWDKSNLIYKAAELMQGAIPYATGVEVTIKKRIPPGKGLGGGSSNAAVTLLALNQLWEGHMQIPEIMIQAKKIGADVPYFLEGGLCLGTGRGDEITELDEIPEFTCLLVLPDFPVSTAFIYNQYRFPLTSDPKESKIIRFLNRRKFNILENGLEETVFKLYPQLKTIKNNIRSLGAEMSLVSGTGSAVFGLFQYKQDAEEAREKLQQDYVTHLAQTVSRKKYMEDVFAGV